MTSANYKRINNSIPLSFKDASDNIVCVGDIVHNFNTLTDAFTMKNDNLRCIIGFGAYSNYREKMNSNDFESGIGFFATEIERCQSGKWQFVCNMRIWPEDRYEAETNKEIIESIECDKEKILQDASDRINNALKASSNK